MTPEEITQFATEQEDGSVLFTRKNGEQITVREMTVADQLAVKDIKDRETQAVTLAANLLGLTPKELHSWPARDFARLERVVTHFFG